MKIQYSPMDLNSVFIEVDSNDQNIVHIKTTIKN